MKEIAYTRISTDQEDLEKQKHLLLEYDRKVRLPCWANNYSPEINR